MNEGAESRGSGTGWSDAALATTSVRAPPAPTRMAESVFADHGRAEREATTTVTALSAIVAGILHLGFAWVTLTLPAGRSDALPRVTEVELAAPPEEPPPPPPPPSPEIPEGAPAAAVGTPSPAPATPAPAPAAARAGNVVVARDDAPLVSSSPDVVDFVTDPDGKSFGSGYVTRGGTADRAASPGVTAPSAVTGAAPRHGDARGGELAVASPESLGRAARLDEVDPCRGRYPPDARADEGVATVALVVRADGTIASATVVAETPTGDGFGAAARSCLVAKTFDAARDKSGAAVAARATIRVRFTR